MKLRLIFVPLILALTALSASAQKNEIGLLVGGLSPLDRNGQAQSVSSIAINTGVAYQINFAHRLVNAHLAALYLEIPIVGSPNTDVNSSNVLLPRSYSSLFITPGLKLKALPVAGLSPYLVAGVGIAHFSGSSSRQDGQPNSGGSNTNAVFDFGGGLDMKVAPFVSLRAEIRDYISGNPEFNLSVSGKQQSVLFAGGVVLRF